MTKFELDTIMECLCYPQTTYYDIFDYSIYHSKGNYVVVRGQIPYTLAKLIYDKYDNSEYLIRVNGDNKYQKPNSRRIIYTYHIDTIEGLAAFLFELRKFKNLPLRFTFEEFLDKIYTKLTEKLNVRESVYDHMLDSKTRHEFFDFILSEKTAFDIKLRKKIEIFDKVVNPFSDSNFEIKNSSFKLSCESASEEETSFTLRTKIKNANFFYLRKENGFKIGFVFDLDEVLGYSVLHYYDEKGEQLVVSHYDEKDIKQLSFNLTNNTFCEDCEYTTKLKKANKKQLLDILDEYITMANNIITSSLAKM